MELGDATALGVILHSLPELHVPVPGVVRRKGGIRDVGSRSKRGRCQVGVADLGGGGLPPSRGGGGGGLLAPRGRAILLFGRRIVEGYAQVRDAPRNGNHISLTIVGIDIGGEAAVAIWTGG